MKVEPKVRPTFTAEQITKQHVRDGRGPLGSAEYDGQGFGVGTKHGFAMLTPGMWIVRENVPRGQAAVYPDEVFRELFVEVPDAVQDSRPSPAVPEVRGGEGEGS
jgi:hypothetical protein